MAQIVLRLLLIESNFGVEVAVMTDLEGKVRVGVLIVNVPPLVG